MNKETLARAKELGKDIQQMEFALSYSKRGQWSHWEYANDRASSFHFEFCKNWSHRDADMQDLPTWLNKPLMEVVERELERCKHELETLGGEQEGNSDKTVNGLHASAVFVDEEQQPIDVALDMVTNPDQSWRLITSGMPKDSADMKAVPCDPNGDEYSTCCAADVRLIWATIGKCIGSWFIDNDIDYDKDEED